MGRKKTTYKVHEPIKIRFRELSDGQRSIYLDTYIDGKRSCRWLHMYIKPTDTAAQINEIMRQAEAIRQACLESLRVPGGVTLTSKRKVTLYTYIEKWLDGKTGNLKNAKTMYKHLQAYTSGKDCRLVGVDGDFVRGFEKYLSARLKTNSVATYLKQFKQIIRAAVKDGLLPYGLTDDVRIIEEETHIDFLTAEEVQRMADTEAPAEIKNAFLFCCFTGLRFGDMVNLSWGNVICDGGKYSLDYKQCKTHKEQLLPLNPTAVALMGERGRATDKVFANMIQAGNLANYYLKKWGADAGIQKKLHWHCSRHTFATLLLNNGAGIHTVQKLLGHSTAKQSETYAKLLEETKRAAVNALPTINLNL